MSVWDMYEEFAEKNGCRTELGEERQIGVTLGIVEENDDSDRPGMLKVRIPVRDEESSIVRWARMTQNYSGAGWGQYFLPEKDDQVLLAYERGHVERPYVIASVPRDKDSFLGKSAQEKNGRKRICTRHGTEIAFEDCKDGDGEKDCFHIRTAGQAWTLSLDNEKKTAVLMDKEKKCEVTLHAEKGEVTMKAKSRLTLQAGDAAKLILNGENGTVTVSAKKVVIQGDSSVEVKSSGTAKISGQQTSLEASSMLKVNSSGMTSIGGTPVKIG